MKSERWQRIEELYHSATDLPEAQRSRYLQEACGGDKILLEEVVSLLRNSDTPSNVLDKPAMAVLAREIAAKHSQADRPRLEGKRFPITASCKRLDRAGWGWFTKPKT